MASLRSRSATTKRRARWWSWRHDALVLVLAAAVVACAHVTRAQDDSSSSTGDDGAGSGGSGGSSSSGDDVLPSSSSSSTGVGANRTRRNTSLPFQFVPGPQPNVSTRYCDLPEPASGMRVYDNTTVCFVVGGKAKILFYVNVDEFSVAQIMAQKNATALPNRTGLWDHPKLWFQAEYGAGVSAMKYRHPQVDDAEVSGYVVPYWTLIINLKDGLVESLDWDDGCFGCGGDACVDSTCAVDPVATGCTDPNSRADCNPKFFVSWFGTDRDGVYLTSAGSRSSRFRQYSLSSAVGNAYQSASSAVELEVRNQNVQFPVTCTDDPDQDICKREPGT